MTVVKHPEYKKYSELGLHTMFFSQDIKYYVPKAKEKTLPSSTNDGKANSG